MHQTFYIDLEEEISSVIDRLNKSMSVDNYFVVPKRAIFLQSIVNLKLLRREADKVGKHVVIITQDEIGASMAVRSGIEVRSSLDGLDPVANVDEVQKNKEAYDVYHESLPAEAPEQQEKHIRLSGVGSNDYYDLAVDIASKDHSMSKAAPSKTRKIPINSVSVADKKNSSANDKHSNNQIYGTMRAGASTESRLKATAVPKYAQKLDSKKEKTLEKMYATKELEPKASPVSMIGAEKNIKKIFVVFMGLCLFAFVGVAVYLFLPSAKVVIEPNILKNKIDLDLNGSVENTAVDNVSIPIRVLDKEVSVSLSYDVKGGATATGKKAHGSVVIYNEYDNSVQTLIATTRLESTDGKIFRLVKNVVVPGMTTVAGEVRPGAITAEVVADQAGSDYNINPTSFTIPGFKDSSKYQKFYAKSAEKMIGGSTDGETAGGSVAQSDIDKAKQKTEAALKEKITQDIDSELKEGEIALTQAEKVVIVKSSAGARVGDITATFSYTATAQARVLVFSQNDVKKSIEQSLDNKQQSSNTNRDISKIEYGTLDADFDKNTFEMKVYAEITAMPIIDTDQIKKELLGKTDDQLAMILKKYTTIKSLNIEFAPTFVSRIPQYPQRVDVEIKNDAN